MINILKKISYAGILLLGISGCNENDDNSIVKKIRVKNYAPANGYDCQYSHDFNGNVNANNLRIGRLDDDPNSGFKGPFILASDLNRDGIFDEIHYIKVPKGDPLEEIALRDNLQKIGESLLEKNSSD